MIADENTVTQITLKDLSLRLTEISHLALAGQEVVVTEDGIDLFKIVPVSRHEQKTAEPTADLTSDTEETPKRRRHPITMENSPEETMRRMASFPERAARFRETLRALRETNSR